MLRLPLILCASAALALTAGAEICRSVSASWENAGSVNRTVMWTTATNGCKDIEHQSAGSYDEIYAFRPGMDNMSVKSVRGVDCNCDLVADGEEGQFSAPPGLNGQKLQQICQGPVAIKAA
jgi:hypothetical protein